MKKLIWILPVFLVLFGCDQLFNSAGPPTNKGYSADKDWDPFNHPDGDNWRDQRQPEKW